MRANDLVLPTKGTFALSFPQDGISQPATFQRTASNRRARSTVTVLVKPNANDPLASVTTLQFIDPTTTTDPNGLVIVGTPLRLNVEVRIPSTATDAQIAAFKASFQELSVVDAIVSALFSAERLV